jgi:hypothetical protein
MEPKALDSVSKATFINTAQCLLDDGTSLTQKQQPKREAVDEPREYWENPREIAHHSGG